MNTKKVVVIVILLVLIGSVWYFSIPFIRDIYSQQQIVVNPPHRESFFTFESLPKFNFVYKNIQRDPFYAVAETVVKVSESTPLRYYLRGIVFAKEGAIALIEMPDGNVYTMKRGEEYMGAKIKKITQKSVVLKIRGHEIILNVWE